MKVAIPKEVAKGETRVAIVPDMVAKLRKAGLEVVIASGAGSASGYPDERYRDAGAEVLIDADQVYGSADVLLKVAGLGEHAGAGKQEAALLRDGAMVITFLDPLVNFEAVKQLAGRKLTGVSMELVPRITRAQSMDALSSMANIAGYKAVLLGAAALPKMFPMMMTAAGTVSPARALVIGAGVAGLQAIATAKRLGAVVSGYDVRPAVKEQVESLGAKFVEMGLETRGAEGAGGYAKEQSEDFLARQREMMARVVAENDLVITTAAIPGKQAPVLITKEMVEGMAPGSVIVDLAAERGGNCALTEADKTVVKHGVTIIGTVNLPATVAYHASQLYARNVVTLLLHFVKDGELTINFDDEITAGCVVTHDGEIVQPRVRELMGLEPLAPVGVAAGESATGMEAKGSAG